MATTTLAFGGDTIANLPANGGSGKPGETSLIAGATDYIFASGASRASVSVGPQGASSVSIVLTLSAATSTTEHATLFAGGSSVTAIGGAITYVGTAAGATSFLDNTYVIDSTNHDAFQVKITATQIGGHTPGTNSQTESYGIACFVAGTRIATPGGERAVETLAAGDVVTTEAGERRVGWVGTRTYEAGMLAAEAWLRPVEIRRGALGRGLPRRDLRVSGEHALLLDGALVRAAALVNGRTIFLAPAVADVTYYHVELENEHGILSAEGAPCESFRDEGSRVLFDNAAEFTLAHGTASEPPPLAAPRVDDGYRLETIRHRLAGGADEVPAGTIRGHVEHLAEGIVEGWAMDAANPLVPVELEIRVGGKPVGHVLANRYRTDLHRAGIGIGRAGFRFALPEGGGDTVSVVRAFDGAPVPMEALASA